MSSTDALAFFHHCCAGVHTLLLADVEMAVVEQTIDGYTLDREEKDAVWLWASARRDHLVINGSGSLLVGRAATHPDRARNHTLDIRRSWT